MTQALFFGLLASSAFPIGVALGLFIDLPRRLIASVIAFGAGVLVVALTGEMMAEALEEGSVHWLWAACLLAPSLTS
jgi:ZIP family zinc transporter